MTPSINLQIICQISFFFPWSSCFWSFWVEKSAKSCLKVKVKICQTSYIWANQANFQPLKIQVIIRHIRNTWDSMPWNWRVEPSHIFLISLQSVIECLNYMATGDMPPGSRGNLFVHDPKVYSHSHPLVVDIRVDFIQCYLFVGSKPWSWL